MNRIALLVAGAVLGLTLTACGGAAGALTQDPDDGDSGTGGALVITTTALPGAVVGVPYSQVISAAGGSGAYSWKLTGAGALPLGLNLTRTAAGQALISGTPVQVETAMFRVWVQDAGIVSDIPVANSQGYTIDVVAAPLSIVTTSLPDAIVGGQYDGPLFANPFGVLLNWSASGLPAGLMCVSTSLGGMITGIPAPLASGQSSVTYDIAVQVSNGVSTASATIPLIVFAAPVWTIDSGELPPGLVLAPHGLTVDFAGTPTREGIYDFTLRCVSAMWLNPGNAALPAADLGQSYAGNHFAVTPGLGQGYGIALSITVVGPASVLTISDYMLPVAQSNVFFHEMLWTRGGSGEYDWQAAGAPSWLWVRPVIVGSGASAYWGSCLEGTPQSGDAGSLSAFDVTVVDRTYAWLRATVRVEVYVHSTDILVPVTAVTASQGVPLSCPLRAFGGANGAVTQPAERAYLYAWTLTGGALPSGLGLIPPLSGPYGTWTIDGTPAYGTAQAAPYIATFRVTCGSSETSVSVSVTVGSAPPQVVAPAALLEAQENELYGEIFVAGGGTVGGFNWRLDSTSGPLPSGLNLEPNGSLAGKPGTGTTGPYNLSVRAEDTTGSFAIRNYVLTVRPAALPGDKVLIGGNGGFGFDGDGKPAARTALTQIYGLAIDNSGTLFVAESAGFRVRRIDGQTRVASTVAGGGSAAFATGTPATEASVTAPGPLAVDTSGKMYFAEIGPDTLCGVDTAGNAMAFGVLPRVILAAPMGLALSPDERYVYVGTCISCQIWRLDTVTGGVALIGGTDLGGNGPTSSSGDSGPASAATFPTIRGLGVDAAGNLYVCENGESFGYGRRIRKLAAAAGSGLVSDSSTVTTLSQTGGLDLRSDILFDAAGDMYFASETQLYRMTPAGQRHDVAALESSANGLDRLPLAIDPAGSLYYAGDGLSRIYKIAR